MRREFERTQQFQMDFILHYLANAVKMEHLQSSAVAQHVGTCTAQLNQYVKRCLDRLVPLTTSQSNLIPILELNFDNQLWTYTSDLFRHMGKVTVPFEFRNQNVMFLCTYKSHFRYFFLSKMLCFCVGLIGE